MPDDTRTAGPPASGGAPQESRQDPPVSPGESESEGETGSPVTYLRLGVDLELDPTSDAITYQTSRIHKIENLQICPHLKRLALNANDIEKIENLESTPELEELELYQNRVRKIEGLSTLSHLRVLDLSFNKVRKIENLETAVKLVKLYLSSNKIQVIEGLETLTRLELLELGSNRIREIQGIATLTELKELWLGKNKITEMKLPPLLNLQRLSIQSNRLTRWNDSLFSSCPSLEELYLSHNRLTGAIPEAIGKLKKLKILDLGANAVDDMRAVAQLPELEELWINDNHISSLEAVKALKSMDSLRTLYLEGNPIHANLGPSYRQNIVQIFPKLQQLDALLVSETVNIIQRPLSGKVGATKQKSIMKHNA
ncbi:leucine-rich repeat protein LRR1 [Toxoplasma gondii ME49]|uniref:Leucine-rich repeat protein 1 n=8 Tax=Toxoplasma gondii TaxID=5811 RepID=Q1KTE8_TOXGO|nr:leucine-rich repeat protein LRR1 [Toxoplasma gondii ME49]ABD96037.1 leucine-rich repeat protein 1 [Toxoplasma gondii]KFG38865.1 leucine-rich repeat protein LRR1 [Toxoplasma gondii GAB2-2007-GAL-DOM2]KFG58934.1 leucine-rich repeat protein LRR1 [Toxoplasma gondii RUB]PIM02117.1 leucine-rich repeat protein LRR1 [Toxoplasma gondii COUG]EPT27568.1 leucine-rich repeat protein LRR1 [Toxoplasma gondii ME49]|eukprot:XP_002368823.1 leucine-rich repeat protein LRR1 [Toxoplasma gondii ME49]